MYRWILLQYVDELGNYPATKLHTIQGPDLQNILRQSYDYLTIMPELRSTDDEGLIYQTPYDERRANSYLLAKS